MKQTVISLILLFTFLYIEGRNNYSGKYYNKGVSLTLENNSYKLTYYQDTIGYGKIVIKNKEIFCTDINNNRKLSLKIIDNYRIQIINGWDYMNPDNVKNWFYTLDIDPKLIRICDIMDSNIFYLKRQEGFEYIWKNKQLLWIVNYKTKKKYNLKTKKWYNIDMKTEESFFDEMFK